MPDYRTPVHDIRIPPLLYGTAWKEHQTQSLVELALSQGFRGIDTANQRRHYDEPAVGEAIAAAIERGQLTRDDLFLQTKFTFQHGQDHRLPYDPNAPIADQVEASFASSLKNLRTDRLDSFLLHGPMQRAGLTDDDWAAWKAIEHIFDAGKVRLIGVSNFSADQLRTLLAHARLPPKFVQNRCYASRGWDRDVRAICQENKIIYQGFSLLTANRNALASPQLAEIARRLGRTPAQIIFRFALDIGLLPLTGTTSARHMQEDLDVLSFHLAAADIKRIEQNA